MRYNVLGSFEVVSKSGVCTPTAPKVRQVLAVLVLRAKQVVSIDALIEELWEDDPPRSAVTTAQTYIYQLRREFAKLAATEGSWNSLLTRSPGYRLDMDDTQVDASRFDTLLDNGRSLLDSDEAAAARTLREALALWRGGPMLANVTCGPVLRRYAARFEERYITALELRIAADMKLGRHRELLAELKSLVAEYPFNEWLHAQLIISLQKGGRRGEALQAYQHLRRTLTTELGLEPSADLRRLQSDLLQSDNGISPEFVPPLRSVS